MKTSSILTLRIYFCRIHLYFIFLLFLRCPVLSFSFHLPSRLWHPDKTGNICNWHLMMMEKKTKKNEERLGTTETRRLRLGLYSSSSSSSRNRMTSKQEEDQASPQPSPQAVPSLSERRAKSWIVLVDDEESIRNAVGQLFQSQGYRHVTTCEDGRSALQAALSNQDAKDIKHGETQHYQQQQQQQQRSVLVVGSGSSGGRVPDCIVSDIRMPGMDGLELLQRIRENDTLRQVPVVLLTAKGMTSDRIAGYDSGADAYLSKPFAPEELIAIVDNVIQRHDMLAEVAAEQESKNNVKVEDLKRDLDEIKNLLLHKGGGGVGNGWVEQTNVFLSRDELEVLELLSQGLRNKEIASKTHLSTRRIEQLLTRMFRKTGVKNRTELVRWAVSTGYVE